MAGLARTGPALSNGSGDYVIAFSTARQGRQRRNFSSPQEMAPEMVPLLKKNKGNISHAAREADIDRKYFRKLMHKYGIEGGADDGEE